jgi:hypothetical protein
MLPSETGRLKLKPLFAKIGSSAADALGDGALQMPVATGRGSDAKRGTGGPLVSVGCRSRSYGRINLFAASHFD